MTGHPKPNMNNIVLITGAAGSGKSTVGRRVAEHFPKSLYLPVDHLREMMVNGIALPDGRGWTEEAIQQFQRARSTATYMAQLYAGQGVDVVIDDVCVPPNFVDQYAALFDNPAVHRILLLPSAAALVERLKQRAGPFDHILVNFVPEVYSYLEPMPKAGWIVLDTGEWTIEHTVDEVLSRIGVVRSSAQGA
jgi:predicted kinase